MPGFSAAISACEKGQQWLNALQLSEENIIGFHSTELSVGSDGGMNRME